MQGDLAECRDVRAQFGHDVLWKQAYKSPESLGSGKSRALNEIIIG